MGLWYFVFFIWGGGANGLFLLKYNIDMKLHFSLNLWNFFPCLENLEIKSQFSSLIRTQEHNCAEQLKFRPQFTIAYLYIAKWLSVSLYLSFLCYNSSSDGRISSQIVCLVFGAEDTQTHVTLLVEEGKSSAQGTHFRMHWYTFLLVSYYIVLS